MSTRPAASRSPASRAPSAVSTRPAETTSAPSSREALLDVALVAEQPLVQALELRPVGGQADAQQPDARARALRGSRRHGALLPGAGSLRLARRAAALARRVRARA